MELILSVQGQTMSAASYGNCTFQDTQFLAGSCGATFTLFMGLVEYLVSSKDDIADSCNRPGRESVEVSANTYSGVLISATPYRKHSSKKKSPWL
jgi:hypothetical protein